jgi:hypothetical protein
VENCEDQVLYNNFDFGSNRGFTLNPGANGICLGQGIDQGMNSFYINGVGDKGFNFINTQIVTTAPGAAGEVKDEFKANNRYFQTSADFSGKVTFFGADFWGQPQNISNQILGGAIELQAGNFSNSGQRSFAAVSDGAMFDIIGTNINNISTLLQTGTAPQTFIQSSFVNPGNVNTSTCGLWLNNLGQSGTPGPPAGAFDANRDGWIATASVNNADAPNSLDDNASTRWSTLSERQQPGQWFQVDMRAPQFFTGVYMNAGGNSYLPVAYTVSVSADGENWTDVGSGRNNSQTTFDRQEAQYIRITQTGTGTNSWRVAEFYIINSWLPETAIVSPEAPADSGADIRIGFTGNDLFLAGTSSDATVTLYDLSGSLVLAPTRVANRLGVSLSAGVYIAVVEYDGRVFRKKLVK